MSNVKKLIISRKKIDENGNEYALIKITSNLHKSPEKRIIKFKNSTKKSKSKKEKRNKEDKKEKENKEKKEIKEIKQKVKKFSKKNFSTNNIYVTDKAKISSIISKHNKLIKQNIKSKRSESPTTKSSKFTSFISTFNTPSKGKNSFIYNSQKHYNNLNGYNFKYFNSPNFNNNYNDLYSSNNSEIFKTEYETLKTRENLSKKIMILSRKNQDCFEKINNLKIKSTKINNIKVNKIKDKEEILKSKNKENYEFQFKKHLLSEIKEINKYKKQAIDEIKMKENLLMKTNLKKENEEIKKIIENSQKMNYEKKREKYLKIRNEEKKLKQSRHNFYYNLKKHKRDENYYNLSKAEIQINKEIKELKKKYEKLKMVNSECNLFIKQNRNRDFQRTFTPSNIDKYFKNKLLSFNNIETFPKVIFDDENYQRNNRKRNISNNNYNNSII